MQEYDVIFVVGEEFSDHPLNGIALLKRLLEKNNYSVGIIETPKKAEDIARLGKPRLFFGVSSGSIDSMLRNYTALNRPREEDEKLGYESKVPDRAVIVYSNWIRAKFKDSFLVIGGVESTLRRFSHFDFWSNSIRKSIIFDSRADLLVYGMAEKQIVEVANRLRHKKEIVGIKGTCIRVREKPKETSFIELPSHEEVLKSKEKFCDMQVLLSNYKNLCQKTDNFYILQFESPNYTGKDLDEYYGLSYSRKVSRDLRGFEFSVVTHRGCIGNCNFCSLRLTMGEKIISRSEDSILRELEYISKLPHFKGTIDDFGGPSANMYGFDIDKDIKKSQERLVHLLRKAREVKGIKKIFIRSGVRYDLAIPEYIKEIAKHHISGKLKIAPEHVEADVLELMNKKSGNLDKFIEDFNKLGCGELAFYFMTGHPGSTLDSARKLGEKIRKLKNAESVQIFTPTPMTVSTCMYYTGINPYTKKPVYVPRTFVEKKEQKRVLGLKDYR